MKDISKLGSDTQKEYNKYRGMINNTLIDAYIEEKTKEYNFEKRRRVLKLQEQLLRKQISREEYEKLLEILEKEYENNKSKNA